MKKLIKRLSDTCIAGTAYKGVARLRAAPVRRGQDKVRNSDDLSCHVLLVKT